MSMSSPFIVRPVATTLLTAAIALAGVLGYINLPVAPLPQMDYPVISVQASLPGASPDTMAATIAAPLERSLGIIAGVNEMTSSSTLGSARVTLQFDLSRDIDGAARDVQAAINAARPNLPSGMPSSPTYKKANPADAPIMILALTSKALTRGRMYDAASTVLAQRISQVRGVGQVDVSGSALPAVRVELNIAALNRAGIPLEQVRSAIAATNANRPKGMIDDAQRTWEVGANDQAYEAAEYAPLVIAYRNGAAVRLSDVATVEDSVENVRNLALSNGNPAILIFVRRQPGANILGTVDRVKALMPLLRASIPAAIDLRVMVERTPTIRASLQETQRTLIIAVTLVILVVFLFLRNPRAAVIPAVAVPVSLIGTFGVIYLWGFSLNILTLMALTISTGFVVDDAIVVLENISRHIEKGVPPLRAALRGAREIGFTVLSMSLSLIAVFVPILLMGGFLGRLFREFAVTLSVAILISLLVSLTTTPMMCARLLRGEREGPAAARSALRQLAGRLAHRCSEVLARFGSGVAAGYARSLDAALRHPVLTLSALAVTVMLNWVLIVHIPKGLFPTQETGLLIGNIQADQSTSFQSMSKKLSEFLQVVVKDPAVTAANGYIGGGQTNGGFMFVVLKPISESHSTSDQVIARLRGKLAHVPGATLYLQPLQDLRVGGRAGNAQYQYTLQDVDINELRSWEPRIRAALNTLPELADVNTDTQDKGLSTYLKIDRSTVDRLKLTMNTVDATLNDAFGQRQVSTIYEPLNQYHVVMEAAPRYDEEPSSLNDVNVISPSGAPVPLGAVSSWQMSNTPLAVNHQGLLAASTISFNLPTGISLGQATDAIDRAMARIGVPASLQGGFQGSAKLFQQSLATEPWLVLAAILAIYIVLGILYESTLHPITIILSTLPPAGVGAVLALEARHMEFTIMALIGLILLIGIVKKNAIMMIDVALDLSRRTGADSREAIRHACLLRFRPIMMTTLAALFGALPLVLVGGEGAQLRQPLGISIVGGLMLSQVLTLYTTPVMYLCLDRLRVKVLARRARREPSSGLAGEWKA